MLQAGCITGPLCFRPVVPQVHYASGQLYHRSIMLQAGCTTGPLCFRPVVPQGRYASGQLYHRADKPQACCAAGPLSHRPVVHQSIDSLAGEASGWLYHRPIKPDSQVLGFLLPCDLESWLVVGHLQIDFFKLGLMVNTTTLFNLIQVSMALTFIQGI